MDVQVNDVHASVVNDHGPPAGITFDALPPAPPRSEVLHSSLHTSALTHARALRRACIDPNLARKAIPSSWLTDDDPTDNSSIRICDSRLIIPVPFDDHCVLTAFERELDRVESKFRAGRKDKSIGGEYGTIIIKKKPVKLRKIAARHTPSEPVPNGTSKRPLSASHPDKFKRIKDPLEKPKKPVDYTIAYRTTIKSGEIPKMVKQRTNTMSTQTRTAKNLAAACVRESRKSAFRSVRIIDEAHRRGRRILREVLAYWKREDKERQEERKKLMARADEHRKQEAEEREAQRQKNKLKFLLGQSEAFSSFLKAKTKATSEADKQARTQEAVSTKNGTLSGINGITGAEDDDELKRIAAVKAAELVEQHQQRIRLFDSETLKKKSVANEASHKAAQALAAAKKAINMKGITEEEREALETEVAVKAQGTAENPTPGKGREMELLMNDDDAGLAGSEKAQVAAVRQPSILNCRMKDYQLRGLAWLVSLYDQGINGILADEMGLGKTLQTISFLAYLCEKEDNWGPFLVVSPKATLHNWQQEITKFCPSLKVLPYWGNKNERNELRKYWSHKRMYRRDSEFQVCVTSYETLTVDEKYFNRVKWQYLVLDEAQAIKNSNSTRWRALLQFPCRNRLLLTGTPLQNKLSELWSLLHFIMPTIFDSHAEFADWFAKDIEGHAQNNKILDASTLKRLRTLLDPFMLRRVKRDVESEMPPKTEVQLPCTLSARQRQLYASIKANISPEELIRAIGRSGDAQQDNSDRNSKLMNLVMQLRKVCNHPETFERRVPQSPFQFQAAPPPSCVALPPSVLMSGNESTTPLDITLVCESEVKVFVPRLLTEVDYRLHSRNNLMLRKCWLWSRPQLRQAFMECKNVFSVARLSGGLSISDTCSLMEGQVGAWEWHQFGPESDSDLLVMENMSFVDSCEVSTTKHSEMLAEPIRLALQARATLLRRRQRCIVLPGHDNMADIVAIHTRLLRSAQVYIPRVWAPVPDLYKPGDVSLARRLLPEAQLPYPHFPVRNESHSTESIYGLFRSLDADYGAHVGTAPIQMPEAGRLIADCGKMMVLDPLLRTLKEEGHKCLIYSQFTRVLDILEDYCGKTSYKFVRLDGQSALADRRDIVAEWQANEELFIFLLSTRAGGVGLNLTAADTVIFFDSDWNPTQDLQAMDRAHRLGQERPVTVYRLISRGTIEERMLIRAQQKNKINDLVIKGGGLNTEVEGGGPSDAAEIDDIAALLMGEEEFGAYLPSDEALNKARNVAAIVQKAKLTT